MLGAQMSDHPKILKIEYFPMADTKAIQSF